MIPNKSGFFHSTKSTSKGFQQKRAKLQPEDPQLLQLSKLSLNGGPRFTSHIAIPEDIEHSEDPSLDRLRLYAKSLPYPIESNAKMQSLLDFYLMRMVQAIKAKDYDPGFLQWDTMIAYWSILKYPIPKEKRIALAKLYYEVSLAPGMHLNVMGAAAEGLVGLLRSKKKLTIKDLRLPWKPIYDRLSKELFLSRRKFEINQVPAYMGYITDSTRRFFHPAAIPDMLNAFLPIFNGNDLNTILTAEYYLVTFLPLTHPQSYLPMMFRLWESVNSYLYDDRMLQFLAQLSELHVDPSASDPTKIKEIPDDTLSDGENRPQWSEDDLQTSCPWSGIFNDVGIFSEHEWHLIMCKCLASMEIPLADTGSLTTGPSVDEQAAFEIDRLRKPSWRIVSLAKIIVYSMAPDGLPTASSGVTTPWVDGVATPQPQKNLGDYLSTPLGPRARATTYLAGSKALDSLAKLIASIESFFHPSNSGSWTADLSAFIKYIVFEFNKRWHEERRSDCKTPMNRRLTGEMKRELVKCLRTVALLAMFSRDSSTVTNIQSCLKSMAIMEPDLILQPVLERAIPALDTLVETQRTTALIKALGAVALSLVSREIHYPGAKHLVPILELLIPGIDMNDPSKTLCTTTFLIEISQYIKFDDLTAELFTPMSSIDTDSETLALNKSCIEMRIPIPDHFLDGIEPDVEKPLTSEEEDALLKQSTASFADWIANFIRRVILLLENLPEEDANGVSSSADGSADEVQVVDSVAAACSQICVHLSEPLFDLVLNMVYDYASTNVRPNAVRAMHQLVECVANADAHKTLAKFMTFCLRNIGVELENGASSIRTTSSSTSLPADATLHWNIAILRGAVFNDGTALLKYKPELLSLFTLLRDKTFSKRGYSWSGKLLSSALLTLTHTYPIENKFVNPEEWNSEVFRQSHYLHWGKLYRSEEIQISWHVPTAEEIDLAMMLFRAVVEPAMEALESLITAGVSGDLVWRNDFCRYMTLVRNAFAGTPTLMKETYTADQIRSSLDTSDILHEIPEMIATIEPVNAGFALTDRDDPRYQYFSSLRHRFGETLSKASKVLRQHGDDNTVDAIQILLRALRTYLLDYGDSRDSYYSQCDQYSNELGLTRQYANQKNWPRAVFVRRARRYNTARLRWNSIERLRGPLEDSLIDELAEWSMWQYATVRETSQSLLESLCTIYDGVRRRCLPTLYAALRLGVENDRMKGALYSLDNASFARYIMSNPYRTSSFMPYLFGCQQNSKSSIQDRVAVLSDTCLSHLAEPCMVVYQLENEKLDLAANKLIRLLPLELQDMPLVYRCSEQRARRVALINESINKTVSYVCSIAQSTNTHWRYAIVAVRILRTLIRRDEPLAPDLVKCFLSKTYDSHPNMRYYAQRAVMKSLRYIKLRTYSETPSDLVLERSSNPLRRDIPLGDLTPDFTFHYLQSFREPLDYEQALVKPIIEDKALYGWLVWADSLPRYIASSNKSAFQLWNSADEPAISAIREVATKREYWSNLAIHLAEENDTESVTQDNISSIKSIFQLLEIEPFEALQPVLEPLLSDTDQNKQRAAAELLAGLLGGSKHWKVDTQSQLWSWFTPRLPIIFSHIKTNTLTTWTTFLEYIFHRRDPRRVQPLVDYILHTLQTVDYKSESAFDITKSCAFFRAFYDTLGWRAEPWMDEVLNTYWSEMAGNHDEVNAYVADALTAATRIKWHPCPSTPKAEIFTRECRLTPAEFDIMGLRQGYLKEKVEELVRQFPIWYSSRLPGSRAIQSTYDRVAVTICKWLYQSIHDVHAGSVFDYVLPLMPELFRFSEVNDNNDLSSRASNLLVRMCGVMPPRALINSLLDIMFNTIRTSPSWKIRLKVLPLIQIFYFRQVPLISSSKVFEMLEVICKCLDDENVEVREMAATTLSGILRLSSRRSVIALKDRFVRLAEGTHIPHRQSTQYTMAIRKLHAAILGICAIVDSYPYTVESWMPSLLTDVLAEHTYDPIPISNTIRKCASNFKKTHQDTWHEDSKRFTDDQLSSLSTLLTGSSYYA